MSNTITCRYCNKSGNMKWFRNHILKIHGELPDDYTKNNISDFKHLNWKLCSECGNLFNGRSSKCGTCYSKNHNKTNNTHITCKCCNSSIHSKQISQHLLKNHNIKFIDYVSENLNDFKQYGWANCVICNKICKGFSKKYNEPTCSLECHGKLRETWVGFKSPMFGKPQSEETKIKIGNKAKIRMSNPKDHPFYGKHHSQETKDKISKEHILSGRYIGKNNPMFGKHHSPETIAKNFGCKHMNKLETFVSSILDAANIEYYWGFCINDTIHCKIYDFKIKGKPIILEIDGDYWHGGPGVKKHCKHIEKNRLNDNLKNEMAAARGYTVIRLWESDIKKDLSIILKSLLR